ncbi:MAG: hypothetical protein KatS3mg110_1497 [Pirellulaceae bacterium]|nr:MAG: hypothetical protein KatS3mg110_1497 [Pirellulaceae bacterium]
MKLDDEVCLCFHVSLRKLINFVRVEKPRRASQLSQCFGAGTGCGWCRPFLKKVFQQADQHPEELLSATPDDYASGRAAYIRAGKGVPPPGDPLRPDARNYRQAAKQAKPEGGLD